MEVTGTLRRVHLRQSIDQSGSLYRIGDFRPRAFIWELLERVYSPLAFGIVGGCPTLGVSELQADDRFL